MADEEVMMRGSESLLEQEKESINQMFLKCIAAVLLVGFAYYLFVDSFNSWTPATKERNSLPSEKQDAAKEQHPKNEVCDLSTGEWIPNPSGPMYTNATCNQIQNHQNCMKNGRPDTGYLYWRWKPSNCDLPPFDPVKFLNEMRHKSWVFIGDSIFRNHFQSLICLVSQVEELVEIYHDSTFKCQTWFSPSYNFTLAVIWAPYLVKYEPLDPGTMFKLHLDILDIKWTSEYSKYDYVVISGGQWFYRSIIMYEKDQAIGCHSCGYENLMELGVGEPYRKALQLTLNFISKSEHKPFVIFRTWTPDHFEYGEWFNGGICNRTKPFKEGEINGDPTDLVMRDVEIEEFEKFAAIGEMNGVRMELLDTYHLSLLRPDGHPGPYRTYHPFDGDEKKKVQNDCLHWCLPGPIDTWNDLMMKMVINGDHDHDSVSSLR